MTTLLDLVFGTGQRLLATLPIGGAPVFVCILLLAPTIVVLLRPRRSIYRDAPSQHWARDLRIWALLIVLPYCLLYVLAA